MNTKRDSWCVLSFVGIVAASALTVSAQAQCAADLDQDGVVGPFDLLIFLPSWARNDLECDINGDGTVDGEDAGLLLAHWGKCVEDLEPHPAPLMLVIPEITDPVTALQGLREFDVFVQFETEDDEIINVFDTNITCNCTNGFIHAPIGSASVEPLPEWMWDRFDLTYDSYITIGAQYAPSGAMPHLNLDEVGFLEGGVIGQDTGWLSTSTEGGFAGNYPDNQIRIATFTTEANTTIDGELTIMYLDGEGQLFYAAGDFFISAIIGDLDNDGVVGASDLLLLLSAWGPCDDCEACPSDLDFDCQVGASDLLQLLANWG